MVHVDHVLSRLELAQALDGPAAPEPAAPADAAGAAEDLVVGEDAEGRVALQDEPPGQGAQRQGGAGGQRPGAAQELLEALQLPRVVAQDQRLLVAGGARAEEREEPGRVPVHRVRRAGVEADLPVVGADQPPELPEPRPHPVRREHEPLRRLRRLAAPLLHLPQLQQLPPPGVEERVVPVVELEQDGVPGEHVQQRPALAGVVAGQLQVHRQDVHPVERGGGALIEDVEAADGADLVAPELQPDRVLGAEAEQVDDAAPHRELAHLLHEPRLLEAHGLQPLGQLGGADLLPHPEGEPERGEGVGDVLPLLDGPGRGHQHADAAGEERLQRLHPLPAHLHVVLLRLERERLPLRVEGAGSVRHERGQVRLHRLRLRRVAGHHHPDPALQVLGQRRRQHGGERAREVAEVARHARPGQAVPHRPVRRLAAERVEYRWVHQAASGLGVMGR